MSAKAHTVALLVMTSQTSEAERLITSLRNGGLAVRGMYSAHPERIDELVGRRACDLILCCGYDPGVDLEAVLARYRALEADCPLIVIADRQSDPQAMIKALRSGARDVTERDDAEHLQLVVGRELADLRARRQVRRLLVRLQRCAQRSRELVQSTDEAVAFIRDGMHVHANPAYLSLFRFPSVDDLQATAFLDLIAADQRQPLSDFLTAQTAGDAQGTAECPVTCVLADASRFAATLFAVPAEFDGEPCLRLIVRETAPQAAPSLAPVSANTQSGLSGYAALLAAIETAVGAERRPAAPFALFYVRIRGAANLLHDFGLTRGLAAIGTLAKTLKRLCGDPSLMARISDDGYAFLAPRLDEAAAETLAERIRAEMRLPQARGGRTGAETACDVGYVIVSGHSAEPSDLLDEVYRACGDITRSFGRATAQKITSLATRGKQPAEEGDDAMMSKLEYALANDRFLLVYQPIISLMGDNQENYSVLVRVIDEAENLLEAHEFIGAGIRSGMIERIDKWAIRTACKVMSEKRNAGQTFNFFINLAEDTFRDPGAIIWICECLREFDVRGSWFTFVIQEELVDDNLGNLARFTESLKKIKCRVAVNRFGATDHPQMLFQGIPLDFVMLLPEYAQGLADDRDKQQRLLALANLSREFNVKSIVTGVEDARALTILWTAGVDYVQGNFLQRPSPTLEIST